MQEDFTPTIFVDFLYVDPMGNETQMSKTVNADYMSDYGEIGPLCELFKEFMLAAGFTYLADKKVEWVPDNR